VSDWPNSETLYLMKAATKTGTTEIGGREIVWAIRRLVFGQKPTGYCASSGEGAKPRADRRYPVVKRPHRAA